MLSLERAHCTRRRECAAATYGWTLCVKCKIVGILKHNIRIVRAKSDTVSLFNFR